MNLDAVPERAGLHHGPSTRATKLTARLRSLFAPVTAHHADLGSSSTVSLQIWWGRLPWRPTAGWAALAGVLAGSQFLLPFALSWPTAVLLFLLVDPLWGSLWRLAAGRSELLPLHERVVNHQMWLPYLRPQSPAASLFGRNTGETWPVIFRIVLPTVLLTLVVASTLGMVAVLLTGVVMVIAVLGWISTRHALRAPVLLHSVVTVGLPWFLAAYVVGVTAEESQWRGLVMLLLLWVLHEWGAGRLAHGAHDRLGFGALAAADLLTGLFLIWLQTPLWFGLWFVLTVPTWFAIQQARSVRQVSFWTVAAMLASAVAVSQSVW